MSGVLGRKEEKKGAQPDLCPQTSVGMLWSTYQKIRRLTTGRRSTLFDSTTIRLQFRLSYRPSRNSVKYNVMRADPCSVVSLVCRYNSGRLYAKIPYT